MREGFLKAREIAWSADFTQHPEIRTCWVVLQRLLGTLEVQRMLGKTNKNNDSNKQIYGQLQYHTKMINTYTLTFMLIY